MIDFALLLGGFLAGFINALAGGGSTVTLPLLLLCGLDASVANGTNRIAVLFQSVSASRSFAVRGRIDWQTTLRLLPWVLLGAILGAVSATKIDTQQLEKVFGITFLVLGFVLVAKSKLGAHKDLRAWRKYRLLMLVLVGFYGGFLQAGVGIPLLMVLLGLYELDFDTANGTKVFHIAIYSLAVLLVFGGAEQVDWRFGLELGFGGLFGSHVGAQVAMRSQPRFLSPLLSIFLVFMGIRSLL